MDARIIFWIVFAALALLVLFLNAKYFLLHDDSVMDKKKPYSFARAQLTWWTVIVLSSFISVFFVRGELLTFNSSALILLGISVATTISARLTDLSDKSRLSEEQIVQNKPGKNFFLDILSDSNGVSITRLQTVIFNLVIGLWFIHQMLINLVASPSLDLNSILPVIEPNNLILIGLSSGTYAALKTQENKNNEKKPPAPGAGEEPADLPPVG
ncbi:MAG: hypothetical protein NTW10_12490 [Bacteroidetes bacterium]|nr:hypothetical protein [Bacteroidota bacterium]